jgi:hypothetical protein
MNVVLRVATRDDIAAMHRVRMAVREHRLVSTYPRPSRTWEPPHTLRS